MSHPDQLDDLKSLKSCDENKTKLKAFSMSEIHCFQRVSIVFSSRPIGLDQTYLMLLIIIQHNPSQKSTKFAVQYFSRTETWGVLMRRLFGD
jgi:hypothetical protein